MVSAKVWAPLVVAAMAVSVAAQSSSVGVAPTPVQQPASSVQPAAPSAAPPAPQAPSTGVAAPSATPSLAPQEPSQFLASAIPHPGAAAYPNMPTSWPDSNQVKGPVNIPALFEQPLIKQAIEKVNKEIPKELLSIPLSTQLVRGAGGVTYPGGTAAQQKYCHYAGGCTRKEPGATFNADVSACKGANQWGMTFDDGPTSKAQHPTGAATDDILVELDKLKVKTTMFVAGSNCFFNPDIVRKLAEQGHEVGVHTWTHAALTSCTNEQIVAEILFTEACIVRATGQKPRFFRAPFGDVDDRVRSIIKSLGYDHIIWTSGRDTQDTVDPAGVRALVKTWLVAQTGFISLQHDSNELQSTTSVQTLQDLQQVPNLPLQIMPVGQCTGMTWNTSVSAPIPANTPNSGSSNGQPGGTPTQGSSGNQGPAKPTSTGGAVANSVAGVAIAGIAAAAAAALAL
ncbi:hypothetical protein DFS34DRAFT_619219 [Phlyctochytrium arcticum]|nr:hypothetical protein DFS34DRAFT_619219 [Phlyctochytrium arcticum]